MYSPTIVNLNILRMKFLSELTGNTGPLRLLYHRVMAIIAAVYFGFPGHRLTVIAVTGTKGKTTTCNMIAGVLQYCGYKTGMMTSINFQVGEKRWSNKLKQSTLSPFSLQRMLREMVREGCSHVVIEVTSHALAQSRIFGVSPDIAVMTQIDQDHIEYHGTHKAYRQEKLKLFRMLSTGKKKPFSKKISILNAQDEYFDEFKDVACDLSLTYGFKKATVTADTISFHASHTEFMVHIPNQKEYMKMNFMGMFNVSNALATVSTGLSLGLSLHAIKEAFAALPPVPGRQEIIDEGQPYTIVVDYAHTVDSLTKLCELFKPLTKGKLILVFGCTGGGRDTAKRPHMGKVAHEFADQIILTDDDPYLEDRLSILMQIRAGIPREEGEGLYLIADRSTAIHTALSMAGKGDTVVIAGKGCEEVMATPEGLIAYDDRRVVRHTLSRAVEITSVGGALTRHK